MERFRTFTVLISKINRSIRRIKSEVMSEYCLKSPHVSCLYYLYKEETLTAKELSDICDEDKASLSRSIEQLERLGYLSCNSEARKRYKAALGLTDAGRKIAEIIVARVDEVLDYVGDCLSNGERAFFYTVLNTISERLDSYEKNI